ADLVLLQVSDRLQKRQKSWTLPDRFSCEMNRVRPDLAGFGLSSLLALQYERLTPGAQVDDDSVSFSKFIDRAHNPVAFIVIAVQNHRRALSHPGIQELQ